MNTKLVAALALAAGILGGVLTQYIVPPAAFAQNQATAPKEIRAHSFTLLDRWGRIAGTFTVEAAPGNIILRGPQGQPNQVEPAPMPLGRIVLRDSNGREIWSAGGSPFQRLGKR